MSQVANIMGTPNGKKAFKILAISLVVLFAFFILKGLFERVGKKVKDFLSDLDFDAVVTNTTPEDGTTEENSWKPQAKIIADAQYMAMKGTFTSDSSLFGGVVGLSGAQLQMVWAEFGLRDEFDLFGWYAGDLGDSLSIPIGAYTWSDYGMTQAQGEALGCTFWDGCSMWTEQQLMRAIWGKSGLPLSF